ncbi:MAG TPA: cytochrome ubiquinol oxidase subunit I [Gemmatimonadales bacterium]|nr:cytochrome ubiquinol oxidase subunit I [Gemmatimonadales bacterium]
MSDLAAARVQMGMSLAFHIVFAVVGIAMPVLMVVAERRWRRSGDPIHLDLAKRWARGTAILFAVGAVSGTVLSFELGLLWPEFMRFAGAIIGMPFSLEGFAFFTEAIFLGIYLYGWERVSARAHQLAGVMVAVSGALSGVFVVIANAWMNAPTGFDLAGGQPTNVRPLAAMANAAALPQVLHMTLAAYAATGFAVAGIHAWLILRGRRAPFHRHALAIALLVGAPAAILQPLSGHLAAAHVARHQPGKLAAMEALFETRAGAPVTLGGWPDASARRTRFGLEVPYVLSLLAFDDPRAVVRGLDTVPRDEWPSLPAVHLSFQLMVACGTYMALVGLWAAWLARKKVDLSARRRFLWSLVVGAPLGFVAIEAGWMVTELGRQPWVIYGVLRTADAVTPMPGQMWRTGVFALIYVFLAVVVTVLLSRQIVRSPMHTGEYKAP